ncbi:N-acetylmuramoyl-L-alanine amidase [Niallia sp.]|uniref:N-acetylmuramoyl-L-alanine amidase n=1 Tax=Niallia sp. TaxID=2837523 RepID=UPI0028A1AEFC|nr:N-acetylmuramoyl-L-alanine amidase [Niallia sp.]
MRKNVLLLVAVMVFSLVFPSNLSIAMENENTEKLDTDLSYYFIYYNGEKQEINLNEEVVLHVNGWTDETQTSVQGYITDKFGDHEAFSMNVGEEREQLSISEEESISYRITPSDSYKAEKVEPVTFTDQVTVVTENDNGTSIEEVKMVDEYGTVIQNQGLFYYSTDDKQQKAVITKEEYAALNVVKAPSSTEDAEEASTPTEDVPEELPTDEKVQKEDDQKATAETEDTSTSTSTEKAPAVMPKAKASRAVMKSVDVNPSINYASYVQGSGWQNAVKDGALSGTSGQAKRLEALKVSLNDNDLYSGGVTYKTHVQGIGWTTNAKDGAISGAPGQNKRMEAIQVQLTGEIAKHYDIYYRLHVQSFGWLGWAKNGASAGTEGLSKRVEAIQIKLVKKGEKAPGTTSKSFLKKPSVAYATRVQTIGWQSSVIDGAVSGTSGQAKRLEGIKIKLRNNEAYSGNIVYSTHVQGIGWQNNVANGSLSGTSGQNKRLEAIRISLSGDMAKHYDIYYRVHAQTYGWLGWAKNGVSAGTEGLSKRLEAIQIVLVNKGGKAPGSTSTPFVTKPSITYTTHVQSKGWLSKVKDGASSGTTGQAKRLEAIKIDLKNAAFSGNIVYSTHVQGLGWVANSANGDMNGTEGQSKRLEGIKISLTGEMAEHYDVYYRVHAQSYGWLGWAKNGMKAGTEGLSKRLESIQIKLVPKGTGSSVSAAKALIQAKSIFLDPGHGGSDPGAMAGGYTEADLNLSVAKKVQKLLKDRGYIVYMSRTSDTYVSLLDRSKKANALNPDIFVSLHHNSTGSSATSVNGIESYYYKYYPGYPSVINSKMHNNSTRIMKSTMLASLIQNKMVSYTGAANRGIDGDTFAVLRETAVPATLLELGFINNPTERKKLVTSSYQNKTAKAIADGIEAYFKRF